MESVKITMHETSLDAPNYTSPEYLGASLEAAVIVGQGTTDGNATVDLVFTTPDGQKYITMTTAAILDGIRSAVAGVEARGDD